MNNNIYTQLVKYIEDNKYINNIKYAETIDYLKELIDDIEKEYSGLIREEQEENGKQEDE